MSTITSKDGTTIAYNKISEGPAVILVNGALAYRPFWAMGRCQHGWQTISPSILNSCTYARRGRR